MMKKWEAAATLAGLAALVLLMSCAPSPESLAAATATVLRAQVEATRSTQANIAAVTAQASQFVATQTSVALAAQATTTAVAFQAHATATTFASVMNATQTAVPYDAPLVATRAQTTQAHEWLGVLTGLALLAVFVLLALSVNLFLRNRAAQIRRDAAGQLPMVYREGVLVDPARMIGPALILPTRPGFLWNLRRLATYLRTGNLEELPAPHVTLTDTNASSDQLLTAAQSAQLTAGIAAMFQPGVSTDERLGRLRAAEQAGRQNLPFTPTMPSLPAPRVIVQGNDAIETIARVMGDRLPELDAPASTEIPAPMDAPASVPNGDESGHAE